MGVADDVAVEAQFLLLVELIGLGNATLTVEWADGLIRRSEAPAIEIIDLAMVLPGNRRGLIAALEALGRPVLSSRQLANALLSRLRNETVSANLAPRQVAEMLSYFRGRCSVLTPDEDAEFSIATDKLEIAERYEGSLEEVTRDFIAFLMRYA